MPTRTGRSAFAAALLAVALLAPRARATNPSDLCTGTPCTVSGAKTIDADSVLDFGSVDLVFAPSAIVTIGSGGPFRPVTIFAKTVTLQGGARLFGGGDNSEYDIETTGGDIVLEGSGTTRSKIDVSGDVSGEIDLIASGSVTVNGLLIANGTNQGDGGIVTIAAAAGDVQVTQEIDAKGLGGGNGGGTVSVDASGAIGVLAIDVTAGNFLGGGEIDLTAGTGDIVVGGHLDASGGGADGAGGVIDIETTSGSATINGQLTTLGQCVTSSCSDGGPITVLAGGGIEINADLTASGGCNCTGGDIDLEADGDFTQALASTIASSANGADGSGGSITLAAGNTFTQTAGTAVKSNGGAASSGGGVTISAGRDMTLAAIDASGGSGGTVDAETGGGIATVQATITVDATAGDGTGGDTFVEGCSVRVLSAGPGKLSAKTGSGSPGFGTNQLTSLGGLGITMAGTMIAGSTNTLEYKTTSPVVTGTITPAAIVTQNAALPDCTPVPCGNGVLDPGETCDDGNTLSCDGCRADCSRPDDVCGDGIVECGEGCEPPGTSTCDASCQLIAGVQDIPGTSLLTTGCFTEWEIDDPGVPPASNGFPAKTQPCVDGDPECDADGANDGRCAFRVRACSRATDSRLPGCHPAPIDFINQSTPNPLDPGTDPTNQANAAALLAALKGLGGEVRHGSTVIQAGPPDSTADHCTTVMRLVAPHTPTRSGSKNISVSATDTTPKQMKENRVTLKCLPSKAVCGNGIIEAPEQCEDGNTTPGDGCSPTCHFELCGNGVLDPGEQCDDGGFNGEPGDGCTVACTEAAPAQPRIPGGGSKALDCALEWTAKLHSVSAASNGVPKTTQSCTDGDPLCDFDPAPGTCRFHVWECVGGADVRLPCSAAQVASVDVRGPSATQNPPLNAALVAAIQALGFPVGPGEECTARVDVSVVRGKSTTLRLRGHLAGGALDSDTLRLRCVAP